MDRIGEYLIKRLIGEGGMGKVYEAEERLSGRRVALKVLRPELTRNEDGRRMFLNEMQILAHLEHPSLVRSLASMEVDGQLVLVLEYLRGRTLRAELTSRGTLPWPEALEHVARIAEALVVAHGQEPPIVHRDLKPENVMLTVGEGVDEASGAPAGVKVMDFGIAKVLEGMHGTTQSIGTLQYMSPEQIDARGLDGRSDLYSLGLVFYEMLAGEPPFHSASPRELLNLQCTAPAPPLPDDVRRGLPRGVEDLLFQMLEKAPEDRPKDAEEVKSRLAPFRSAVDAPGTERIPGKRAERATRPSRTPTRDVEADAREEERRSDPPRGDTMHSGRPRADEPASRRERTPKNDTIALVEKNAGRSREIPTWMAVAAIVALSLVAGLTTYLVRLRVTSTDAPAPSATAEAQGSTSARGR